MSAVTIKSSVKVAGGILKRCSHSSISTKSSMNFSVFLPPSTTGSVGPVPAMFWLSGLTCTDENFVSKASNAFTAAAKANIAIVMPDTSPRENKVKGDDKDWDFGTGASFYGTCHSEVSFRSATYPYFKPSFST